MSQDFAFPQPLDYALPPSGPDRDSDVHRLISWIVIVASVAALGWSNWRHEKLAPVVVTSAPPGMSLEVMGRYEVGLNSLGGQSGNSTQLMAAQLDMGAKTLVDRLAAVTIIAEIQGKKAALARLDELKPTLPEELAPQAQALRKIYTVGVKGLSPEERAALRDRLGWLGKLALTFGQPATDPDRAIVLADAGRTIKVAGAGFGIGVAAMIAGVILLIVLLIYMLDRKFPRNYHPPVTGGGVYLEAFAIYLGGMTAISFSMPFLPAFARNSLVARIGLMLGPTILAMLWPAIRGVKQWRSALGWHAGTGAIREIGLGLVGYITGLPLLAIGFLITILLINKSGAQPSHPIDHMLGVSPALTLLVISLAGIYAPITEETMFRGAFFSALRARHGWILSAIVSSFIFAAIHPQGWSLIPMLMSIAIVLAGIREWRGTILSSAAAHCLHNTALVVIGILMMS